METVIVFVDDAAHATERLQAMLAAADDAAAERLAVHWILVACAPRMTHRISKWVSHSAREHWRSKWSDRLFTEIVPWLQARGDQVTQVLAKGPLPELQRQLQAEHSKAHVLDARRPRPAPDGENAGPRQPPWTQPGSAAGLLGLALLLGIE